MYIFRSILPPSTQFSQYLHENAAYVRPLEDSFLQLHQSITEDTVTVLVSVFGQGHGVGLFIMPDYNQPLTVFFFLPILILKETVVKLKSFADNFSSYTHFLQKILPYQLKRSVLLVRARWQNGVEQTIDDYPLFSSQLGRRVRGASMYCCTYREKPGAAGRHEESNFCVWETAELH